MPRNAGLSQADAKSKMYDLVAAGLTIEAAVAQVGRSVKWHDNMRSADREIYARRIDEIRARRKSAAAAGKDQDLFNLSFADWRMRFLGRHTYDHMQSWIDVIEGREPTLQHPSVEYDMAEPNRVIINVPPFHAKSQTITVDYLTYKICMDPNIRILIVSKKQDQAKKFLYQIKQRLTSNLFAELQAAYAPEGGFRPERGAGEFAGSTIYVAGRDTDEKDPTVECVGLGGQIYGSRADIIVMDDVVVGSNAGQYDNQIEWLESEVENRVFDGLIVMVGTRLKSVDMYSELRRGERYLSGTSPWTYLRMPMVLEFAEDPKDWVTLWPASHNKPDQAGTAARTDGMYTMFDGPRCNKIRDGKPPHVWALVYQQQQTADDSVFHPLCVQGCVDGRRKPGPMRPGEWGGRRQGMEGLHVIGSIDPAGTGEAFVLVYAVDRQTKERWVLNCWPRSGASSTAWYADLIERVTPEYGVSEWVIEQNAYATWLINDERIVNFCRTRGVKIIPHYTGHNKQDPDFGVASVAPLFGHTYKLLDGAGRESFKKESNLIHLPSTEKSEPMKQLIEQLIQWQPGKRGNQLRQDGPMALWFAELRARQALGYNGSGPTQNHMQSRYLSRSQRQRQMVVPADTYQALVGAHE